MRFAPLLTLALLLGATPGPQQAGKKPKPALASAIDSAAGSLGGPKQSPLAEDGEFLRRLMLDLVGYPPNLAEVKAFMADANPNKRADKIDELLDTEDWADRTARLFCEGWFENYHDVPIMLTPMIDAGVKQRLTQDFVKWLKGKLQKDAPYNSEIVDAIIRARGTGTGDPALLWKLSCFAGDDAGPVEFANRVSKHFLGIRLKCAQCHDHPFDVWNEGHFYKLAAFFGRTRAKGGADAEISEGGPDSDAMMMRAQGTTHQPQFIFGQKPGKLDPWMDALAVYMTGPQNPQLAMAAANRVWSWLFGRGLVHPVDDFNKQKAPIGGGLLGVLAREFKANKYSVKALYRGICNSDAYQRASANDGDMTKPSFAAAWIKHLDAEQLLNSIQVATTGRPAKNVNEAMSKVAPLFPADVVWCEVTPLPGNMRQALLLRNNHSIHSAISGGGVLQGLSGGTTAEKVKEMFLAALSRVPTPAETERFVKYIDGHPGQGMEDAYWALLNTTEFLTRH
ncbi:MAG TPA: DUF1549 domain-containing protein [Planctomycetota bacterium]|nr:DUF1549 domain-containing protein [Planctomycetota bacterium]